MKENKFKNILIVYWIIVPLIFYVYLVIFSYNSQLSVKQLLLGIPTITITFLLSCLLLLQASTLYFLTSRNIDYILLQKFLNFSLIQQIFTANFIGAFIIYKYLKNINKTDINSNYNHNKNKLFTYSMMIVVGIISILIVILTFS